MRWLLGRFGVRVTVAAGLLLIVAGVVTVGRLGDGRPPLRFPDAGRTPSTVDPTAGDDGAVPPNATAGVDDDAVHAAAAEFVAAWLRRDLGAPAWHTGVAGLATQSLATSLHGVDPRTVPARRTAGDTVLVLRTDRYAVVAVPVDTGTVTLNLLKVGDGWLVDGVGWERA